MKKQYNVGEDIFLVIAFVSFVVGGILTLLGISELFWGITSHNLISLSIASLFFSMALSLHDLALGQKDKK